jgi:cation diffusion facilitator family transporter
MDKSNQRPRDRNVKEGGPNADSLSEIRKARRRAAVSVCINLALSLGKGIAGVLSGSSALLGDAIHSGTDVVASAAAYVGLWLAGRSHSSFPYGLYKAESVATLVTSAAIILAGYEIGRRALFGPESSPDVMLALPVAAGSLIVTLAFGIYQVRAGRRLHSPALVADGRDYLADAMSTGVVVTSLVFAHIGFNLDRWAAGAVSAFIFWSGGQLLWRALRDLMDEAIDRDTEREIISVTESHARVEKVERFLSRTAGGRFIVDMDVVMRTHSLDLAQRIALSLENEILKQFSRVVMARIKTQTHQPDHLRSLTPVQEPGGDIAEHLAKAPWFLMETLERASGKTVRKEHFENPHAGAETKRGLLVGRWLLEFKPDRIVLPRDREGTAVALLKEAGVEVEVAKDAKAGKGTD